LRIAPAASSVIEPKLAANLSRVAAPRSKEHLHLGLVLVVDRHEVLDLRVGELERLQHDRALVGLIWLISTWVSSTVLVVCGCLHDAPSAASPRR